MHEQLQSLEKEIKKYEEATKGVIRIGLHTITSYSSQKPDTQLLKAFKYCIHETFESFQKEFGKK